MNRLLRFALPVFAAASIAILALPAHGQKHTTYSRMAPLSQYLTPHGYVTAVRATNGFTCLNERGNWMSAFDDGQFWNPKEQYSILRTKLVLAGLSKQQMYARISAMVANDELPTPEPGSMSYMLSKYQYINDAAGRWYPMLMFDVPKDDGANGGASWGSNLPDSPVVSDTHNLWPEPQALFVVRVARWSDGTAGPAL